MLKIFIVAIIFFGFFTQVGSLKKDNYLKFGCISLFFLMGLRNEFCFIDTPRYVYQFVQTSRMSFSDVLEYDSKDIIFWIISSFIGKYIWTNYTFWLMVCSSPFIIGFYRLLKLYSEDILVSFSLIWGLGFFVFLFSGVRQTVALGFIIMALSYILELKYKHFIAYTLIATLFHKTAIVFLIMWFLSFVKINRTSLLIYVAILVALTSVNSIFLKDFIFLYVNGYDERFASYESDTATLSNMGLYKQIFFFCISLFILWRKERSKMVDLLINAAAVGILFQSMSSSIAEMFRLSMYFSIANTILLTIAIRKVNNASNQKILSIGIPLLVLVYIFTSNSNTGWDLDYHFFFENITSLKNE